MIKILIPVDGSEHAERAVEQVLDLIKSGATLEIVLLNVQLPIDSGHARMFLTREELENYRQEEGLSASAGARALLDAAQVPYTHHIAVGHPAEIIVSFAKESKLDKIVMGTRGRGAMMEVLLGSVASEVGQNATVPVFLVS